MSVHYWLSETRTERIQPYFPRSFGVLRGDDRRVRSGITDVLKRGLKWRDAPAEYGPPPNINLRIEAMMPIGLEMAFRKRELRPASLPRKTRNAKSPMVKRFIDNGIGTKTCLGE